jgi:hypothetical protein
MVRRENPSTASFAVLTIFSIGLVGFCVLSYDVVFGLSLLGLSFGALRILSCLQKKKKKKDQSRSRKR